MVNDTCEYYQNLTLGGDSTLTSDDISFYIYYYTVMSLIVLVNIVGNTMVITAFVRHKKLR